MTTKKPATKTTTAAKKASKPAVKAKASTPPQKAHGRPPERMYDMTREVKDWIERAQSIMNHQKGEIDRLKAENKELKAYKTWAEHRILRSDYE